MKLSEDLFQNLILVLSSSFATFEARKNYLNNTKDFRLWIGGPDKEIKLEKLRNLVVKNEKLGKSV
jgi:hypothetical protein